MFSQFRSSSAAVSNMVPRPLLLGLVGLLVTSHFSLADDAFTEDFEEREVAERDINFLEEAEEADSRFLCFRPCPGGTQCQLRPRCRCDGYEAVCTARPPPLRERPSCEDVKCRSGQVCVLQPVVACQRPPCFPEPKCIPTPCSTVRCAEGTVCVVEPRKGPPPPNCQGARCDYSATCKYQAEPKKGFCPAKRPLSFSFQGGNECSYDNDCPSDLLCCPGVLEATGGRRCVSPLRPDPCRSLRCPGNRPVCVVRDGKPVCAARACQPDTHECSGGRQLYCTDSGETILTRVPCKQIAIAG